MLWEVFRHSLIITILVFAMMVLVDYINVSTRGRMTALMKGGVWRQYLTASFLGATPGCLGAFMNVSFYVHGLLTFGAMVGGMVATSGDEAFVMLALFPKQAILLFALLFIAGIFWARASDCLARVLQITPCEECRLQVIHTAELDETLNLMMIWANLKKPSLQRYLLIILFLLILYGVGFGSLGPGGWKKWTFGVILLLGLAATLLSSPHYFREHIWDHLLARHIWRVFLWTFFALLFVEVGLEHWNLENFISNHMVWILLIAALLGLIPESGPHLVFVIMYAQGIIPFSVLLVSSLIQDGHGMLPLLSYTIKDSILIKLFNLGFGLLLGGGLYLLHL